jgi:hypothetical protein
MSAKSLKIDSLDLDLENPRIKLAANQREAMQNIIDDQKVKLINLAESIAVKGFSPIDRCLIIRAARDGRFTVLEGNRRVLAAKLLKNPSLVADLEMPEGHKKRLHKAAQNFDAKLVEPVDCYLVGSRAEGVEWIRQRHSGEDEGRGIVGWSAMAVSRFRGRDAALQALDFVGAHADLTEEQANLIAGKFPLTTLDRLLSTPDVRKALGFELKDGKLMTELPAEEALKPLRRIVIDLAEKRKTVTDLKSKDQQVKYVQDLRPADRPNLSRKTGTLNPVEGIAPKSKDRPDPPPKKPSTRLTPRTTVVPKTCKLNVSNAKILEIYAELRTLQLIKHPHAIAVLLRVFLETSVDQYLTAASIPLTFPTANGDKDKSLRKKVEETIEHMVTNGAPKKEFIGVTRGLSDVNHPFSPDILHAYIHSSFYTPTERDLTAAWDNGQPLFERIWK